MKNKIIEKREDGFVISYVTFKDFKNLKILVKNLSKESKCLFTAWLFDENPSFKLKIGQIIVPLTLIPIIGKIAKKIIPMTYLVALQITSPESHVVGFVYLNRFKKISNGYFVATQGTVISDNFQGKGLGTILRKHMEIVAKKEKLGKMIGGGILENEKSVSFYKKNGYEIEKIEKNVLLSCGKRHDTITFIKNILNP